MQSWRAYLQGEAYRWSLQHLWVCAWHTASSQLAAALLSAWPCHCASSSSSSSSSSALARTYTRADVIG